MSASVWLNNEKGGEEMKLSEFSTNELVNELAKREGVRTLSAEPYQLYSITAGGKEIKDDGPAVILIIED